jgi:hypothetical protein
MGIVPVTPNGIVTVTGEPEIGSGYVSTTCVESPMPGVITELGGMVREGRGLGLPVVFLVQTVQVMFAG